MNQEKENADERLSTANHIRTDRFNALLADLHQHRETLTAFSENARGTTIRGAFEVQYEKIDEIMRDISDSMQGSQFRASTPANDAAIHAPSRPLRDSEMLEHVVRNLRHLARQIGQAMQNLTGTHQPLPAIRLLKDSRRKLRNDLCRMEYWLN